MIVSRISGSVSDKAEKENLKARIVQLEKHLSCMADKIGYSMVEIGETDAGSKIYEFEKNDESAVSGDYLNPITFEFGIECKVGLFYTDGSDIWECIKEGKPLNFADPEYFDVI